MIYLNILVLLSSMVCVSSRFNFPDVELTTIVKPKARECYYQFAERRQTLRFEFRVIDAGISAKDLKISFYVKSPSQKPVITVIKRSSMIQKHTVIEPGDYEICLDNSFSVLSSKTVYFEVSVDIESEQYRIEMLNEMRVMENNDTISQLRMTAKTVKHHLETIKHYQDTYRTVEARDINIQEKNLVKVNTFSSLTAVFMMLFGAFHLFVLKSMFNPSCIVYKIFKVLCL